MTDRLLTEVARLPFTEAPRPTPSLLVGPTGVEGHTQELFRALASSLSPCPAAEPAAAIVTTGVLNSPDLVKASGYRHDASRFEVALDIRRYRGSLRANVPWIALVRMELGRLGAGSYDLDVRESVRHFVDLADPDGTTEPEVSERRLTFRCE